jgi:hypothetical protein
MASDKKVEDLAERLRAAAIMGRSDALKQLFEFLVARSADPAAPKEVEIAAAIFGAGAGFDGSQDASVRVYIHRLRQKLDAYYSGPGRQEPDRLTIPKGIGYRITVEAMAPGDQAPETAIEAPARDWTRHGLIAAGIAVLLLLNALAWIFLRPAPPPPPPLAAVRAAPVWQAILSDNRPITLVVGDYYIFGEIMGPDGGNRLVREYSINSPQDLDTYLMQHPTLSDRYMDLDLYYLPVSIAFAFRSIMPVLAPEAEMRDRIHIIQASDLTPDLLKRSNIIYVGYFSGLGLLRDPVFSGSRYAVGQTYDELIDSVTKRHYVSQQGGPDLPNRALRDYGYFSAFTGPNGNHILVIAGTRDVAVMQTAEAVTEAAGLNALAKKAGAATGFEALYEVQGIRRMNLGGTLLSVSPLRTDAIWTGQPSKLQFPNG